MPPAERPTGLNHFIDYQQAMNVTNWVGSANYNISTFNSSPEVNDMIPLVGVGLASTATAFPSGTYNNANAVAQMNAVAAGTHDSVFNGILNAYKKRGLQENIPSSWRGAKWRAVATVVCLGKR